MKKVLYCLFGLLLLFGCEYEVHENYIELKKPADSVGMTIQLEAESSGDTLLIWTDYVTIRYNFATSGSNAIGCIFQLGSQQWVMQGATGSFDIYRSNLGGNGLYELTCEMYASSGSGSIADQLGQEGYQGVYKWPVKVAYQPTEWRPLSHTINKDGYLELSWSRFPFDTSLFDRYEISNGSWSWTSISNINQLSYVCKEYVGQGVTFAVTAHFKDHRTPWPMGQVTLDKLDIEATFDYSRADSIVMKWSNPYRSVITAYEYVSGRVLVDEASAREVCLPYSPFGSAYPYIGLSVETSDPSARGIASGLSAQCPYRSSCGMVITSDGGAGRYGYNPAKDMLYVSSHGEIDRWAYPFVARKDTYEGPGWYVYQYALVDKHTAMAVYDGNFIDLCMGGETNKVVRMPMHNAGMLTGQPTVTNNGKVIAFTSTQAGVMGEVFDVQSGLFETEFPVLPDYPYGIGVAMTPDGAYLITETDIGLSVLSMQGYTISQTRRWTMQYDNWCVNPVNSGELYVSFDSKISKYRTSDLSLVASWDMPGMRVGNVDPKSGYLLVHSDKKIAVIDPKTGRILYSMPVDTYWCGLYGNMLLSVNGFALNLEKELNR